MHSLRSALMSPPSLHEDVLRHLLQSAALSDRSTALSLALLCKGIQPWIEEIIYQEVVLSREGKAHCFLRTIQTSKTKSADFFTAHVRTLFICPDLDPMDVVTLLSTCRGIENLSYWPLVRSASANPKIDTSGNPIRPDPWQRRTPSPPLSTQRRETRVRISKFIDSIALHNMAHIAPRHLSLLLSDTHPLLVFRPAALGAAAPLFAHATHLAVANAWEEWTAWAGGAVCAAALPQLTHLKLDFAVGRAPDSARARWLRTVTQADGDGGSSGDEGCGGEGEKEWERKLARVGRSVADVLVHTPALEVCVLVLRHDSAPARTAQAISRLVSARICEVHGGDTMDADDAGMNLGFDPRLVFAWEREPFRYSHAHSAHERLMWQAAGRVAQLQSNMSSYTVLNCDYMS